LTREIFIHKINFSLQIDRAERKSREKKKQQQHEEHDMTFVVLFFIMTYVQKSPVKRMSKKNKNAREK